MTKAKVTVELTISCMSDTKECLEEGFKSFEEMTRWLIDEEGLFGLVDDEYKILKIEEIGDSICDTCDPLENPGCSRCIGS
jgi:hypothetical protein